MDLQRVEVIKGPQAAYFGRNTFGGAVNLITRDPSTEGWGGSVRLRTTDRSNNEFNAFVEGPIVPDMLSVSVGGRFFDKPGPLHCDQRRPHGQRGNANLERRGVFLADR